MPEVQIALTGATGFIGQHILCTLLNQTLDQGINITKVNALARSIPKQSHQNLQWIKGDLDDTAALRTLVKGANIVIHNAGVVRGRTQTDFHKVNAEGTERIARLAKEAGAQHFILVSSLAAREPHLSHYASSKAAAEVRLKGIQGLNWSIVRPPAVYGPGDKELAPLFESMSKGIGAHPAGSSSHFSVIHVSDLAQFIAHLMKSAILEQLPPGYSYEPDDGSGGYSWQDIKDCAAQAFKRKVRLLAVPHVVLRAAARVNHMASGMLNYAPMLSPGKVNELTHPDWVCRPLPTHIDWQPSIDLEAGLRELKA